MNEDLAGAPVVTLTLEEFARTRDDVPVVHVVVPLARAGMVSE